MILCFARSDGITKNGLKVEWVGIKEVSKGGKVEGNPKCDNAIFRALFKMDIPLNLLALIHIREILTYRHSLKKGIIEQLPPLKLNHYV